MTTYDPGSGGYTLTGEDITFWSPTGQRMGTYTLLVDPGGNGYAPSLSFRWTNSERVYFGGRLIWRGGSAAYSDRLGVGGEVFPVRRRAAVGDCGGYGEVCDVLSGECDGIGLCGEPVL